MVILNVFVCNLSEVRIVEECEASLITQHHITYNYA